MLAAFNAVANPADAPVVIPDSNDSEQANGGVKQHVVESGQGNAGAASGQEAAWTNGWQQHGVQDALCRERGREEGP